MSFNICKRSLAADTMRSGVRVSIQPHSSTRSLTSCVTLDKLLNYMFFRFIEMIVIIIISASLGVPSSHTCLSTGVSLIWLTVFRLYLLYHNGHIPLFLWATTQFNHVYLHISQDITHFNLRMVECYSFKLFFIFHAFIIFAWI